MEIVNMVNFLNSSSVRQEKKNYFSINEHENYQELSLGLKSKIPFQSICMKTMQNYLSN